MRLQVPLVDEVGRENGLVFHIAEDKKQSAADQIVVKQLEHAQRFLQESELE